MIKLVRKFNTQHNPAGTLGGGEFGATSGAPRQPSQGRAQQALPRQAPQNTSQQQAFVQPSAIPLQNAIASGSARQVRRAQLQMVLQQLQRTRTLIRGLSFNALAARYGVNPAVVPPALPPGQWTQIKQSVAEKLENLND